MSGINKYTNETEGITGLTKEIENHLTVPKELQRHKERCLKEGTQNVLADLVLIQTTKTSNVHQFHLGSLCNKVSSSLTWYYQNIVSTCFTASIFLSGKFHFYEVQQHILFCPAMYLEITLKCENSFLEVCTEYHVLH